ncbi:hypothetical protein F383_29683 [Gossypium arboreum]|uniref:Uncharacterized protein n=1 Tax=Gossypium arboreum TaxID=29729 RepID=A0A0B0MWW7_GOSAR|nr:hypothetical protein F383_29683 [Gossypium arboreum]
MNNHVKLYPIQIRVICYKIQKRKVSMYHITICEIYDNK